ncbi:MAG: aromatic ring-hydroxylating dioxygenase subunit alpha [Gammaproteobacteria bacterium]|nr:aromatic ring-hydroxylating dioxygenase subunit alpha [Gammaproteobacteria bacterium]MDH5259844.1 aromatic ring-hydroxylating dioxygenase subunit alpha [Gammaproteobacteria bacterium]MDH5583841.1 aromatic ring-hydroxylating dioxygenase subunit alpha [Gammaproteobacteria bacterium]
MSAVMKGEERSVAELIASQKPGYSLNQLFYTDPEIYDLEIKRIVNRNWILAGHVSQLSEPGDFKVLNVGQESAIIVRGKDGDLKAFANVCRHRGSLVCLEKHGHAEKFTCPYHGWMYDIDGSLTAARNMNDKFDKSSHGLKPVSIGEIHGLIFVCFDENPPSLEGAIRDLEEPMGMFDFENLKVAAQKSYAIPANWKLAIENYAECYHCATAHPEYAQMHTMMLDAEKRERASGHMYERMEACGVKAFDIDHVDTEARPGEIGFGYSRTAMFSKYETGSRDGKPVAPLLGTITGYDGGHADLSFGPFSYVLAYNDHVVCYVFTPIDHNNSNCEVYWLVRGDAVEGEDYHEGELTWLWDITTQADKEIIVNNSKGVHSKYYEPGPFSGMERLERRFTEWVLQELQRP